MLKGLGAKGGNRGDFQRRNARDFNDGQGVGLFPLIEATNSVPKDNPRTESVGTIGVDTAFVVLP